MKAIERLYKYLELRDIKPGTFEKQIHLSQGYLGKMYKRKADMGEGIILQIIENCPEINPLWLLTGQGEILESESLSKEDESLPIATDVSSNDDGIKIQETLSPAETEPMTSTGIPLSQVKAKVYATRSDEEIDRTISAMMERQLMEMYEEGRIYPRKAVEQLVASFQESNQKLLTENAELKAELRRMQLKLSDRHGPEAEAKK